MPSFPGDTPEIRPIFQWRRGEFELWMMTRSPILRLSWGVFHFERCCKRCKYSCCQRRQMCCEKACTCCHLLSRLLGMSERLDSITDFRGPPAKKCPGVSGSKSFGSVESGTIGREFKIASTRVVNVTNSSYVSSWSPITRWRWCLALHTARSHRPPWWGAFVGKKWNTILFSSAKCWVAGWRTMSSKHLWRAADAPIKFVPQSHYMWLT